MKKRFWKITLLIATLPLLTLSLRGTDSPTEKDSVKAEPSPKSAAAVIEEAVGTWARTTLDSMSLDEKIGQLFMIAAYSNKDAAHENAIEALVKKEKIGGLIFMQGTPDKQIELINRFQKASQTPLLISQDSEWGLNMRLKNTVYFPKNMTLGAIRNNNVIFELGQEIGRQCKKVGVQVNFAPVVDVNNNPLNPVINNRSFGENRENVANKGISISRGMEYAGTIACAKHFPGHGDTGTDSHLDLPLISHKRARLDSIELYPFKKLIAAGVPSVMVAHLYIPALDSTPNLASTLSPKIVNDLLIEEMDFGGLIFTDALGMKGVTKFFSAGEADLKALMAGNDVLLFSGDVPKAKELIKKAIKDGDLSEVSLDYHVLKILVTKEWAGLNTNKITPKLEKDELLAPSILSLKKRLFEEAMTCAKNDSSLLPLGKLKERKIACVEIGSKLGSGFHETLKLYTEVERFGLLSVSEKAAREKVLAKLKEYNTVIVGIDGMSKSSRSNYGISIGTKDFLKKLNALNKDVILVVFGSPYSLKFFGEEEAILVAHENETEAKEAAAEAIFGAIKTDGIMPVTASPQFPEGTSILLKKIDRLKVGNPESMGMNSDTLDKIDQIANEAIKMGATPGCVVLVARGDKVVYAKGFGKTEYSGGKKVDPYSTLYDLASVTKVAATTITTMHLVDEGKLDLEEAVSAYIPDFRGKNLSHIKIRNLLQHNAGFKSWIPFYAETFADDKKTQLDEKIYANQPDEEFCIPIVDGLYMCASYQDTMWTKIVDSKVRTDNKVRYSDLSMIVMAKVIQKVTGIPLNELADSLYYQPMGMNNTFFNPGICAPGKLCAPTENDNYWRHKKVQGYVHDQAAAMMGGWAGHAGLFSNAFDLAKALYMVKSGGSYGGQQFFKPIQTETFTSRQLDASRKGLGWDKAEMDTTRTSPCSRYASEQTFGHSGFTGIGVWVDPKYDLIYIFLSNRTFPSANNKKLIYNSIRPKIMDVIYESIFAYNKP